MEWYRGGTDALMTGSCFFWGGILTPGRASVAEEQLCRRFHIPGFRRQGRYYCILCVGKGGKGRGVNRNYKTNTGEVHFCFFG